MSKYVKKTVVIEAVQWNGENTDDVLKFAEGKAEMIGEGMFISTLEGAMRVSKHDYVIKGVKGEFYPCKPDIFEMTYISESEMGSISDGYHTFDELYEFRKMYNAALFNEWAKDSKYDVHKSWRHHEGDECFGGGWFIVVAVLPTGQISNHYKAEDWDLFQVSEVEKALFPFDGHTSKDVLERLKDLSK